MSVPELRRNEKNKKSFQTKGQQIKEQTRGKIELNNITELNIKEELSNGSHLESRETICSTQDLYQLVAQCTVNGVADTTIASHIKNEKLLVEENNNYIAYNKEDVKSSRNDALQEKRMNTNNNGHNRNRSASIGSVPNTSENLTWLSDVATSQSHTATRRPSEGMLSSRLSNQESSTHNTSTMLASAGSPGGLTGVFRSPASISDTTTPRLLGAGGSHISTLYSSTGGTSSLSPYSGMGAHAAAAAAAAQGSHLQAQYSAFYPQFASPSYSHRSLLASGHYPHIESYSAVLQSMGSQVQHASNTQLPRNTYLSGQIPQYSILGTSHPRSSLSVSTSPGPASGPRQSPASSGGSHNSGESAATDIKSSPVKFEREVDGSHVGGGHEYLSHYKDERSHSLSSVELSGGKSVSFKDPPTPRRDSQCVGKDDYKVPSGKEGSLKHRILTRPSDSSIQSSSVDSRYGSYNSNRSSDQPSPKRAKPGGHASTSSYFSKPHHAGVVHEQPQSPGGQGTSPHLHYPPHFMKGSIIQLANGELKRVEDLQTEDFIQSADISNDLKIDSSTVVRIDENIERGTAVLGFVVGEHKVQVTVEATVEHPFFVFGQGWSSCDPEKTQLRYGLVCHSLSVGDICISLTHKDVNARAAELSQKQKEQNSVQNNPSFQLPPRSPKCSQQFKGEVSDTSIQRSENSPMETDITSTTTQDQGQETRPLRKRQWSSSDPVGRENDSMEEPSDQYRSNT